MDTIIGRNKEKKELDEAYSSNSAEFIAVYGRRRVGKTYLIKNYFQSKKCVLFQTTGIYKGTLKQQLGRFSKELGLSFYQGANIKAADTWMEAFDLLTQAIESLSKTKKVVLFFDELPWLATRKSGLISALEYFWNRYWGDQKRIKLLVCGSAASWIINHIIKNRGGLHNRITRKINLTPFTLNETSAYLKYIKYPCNIAQIAKIYMVTGGVPFYLKNFKKNLSIDQNINTLFFQPEGIFFNEFDEMFLSLFQDSEQYKEIILQIASIREGLSRSLLDEKNKLTGKGGRLTKRLEDLEYAGFISSFMPYSHKKRGVFYRISDEYCFFYLKWIRPIKNQLRQNPSADFWKGIINTPNYFTWKGYTFENICYKHLPQIKKTLAIDESGLASPWRFSPKAKGEKGAQIDLLFDRKDDSITLCEIKYTDKPFSIDKEYSKKLEDKIDIFSKVTKTQKQIFLAFISAEGLKKTVYSEAIVNGGIVTLEDLVKGPFAI